MKAAIAISRATECDVYKKDKEIAETQKELAVIKCQLFKEVSILWVVHLLLNALRGVSVEFCYALLFSELIFLSNTLRKGRMVKNCFLALRNKQTTH